jgi:D-alanyl-D-alanine-carboxypeptidase/D-alanyl-D-alanine-endopeptidase
MKYAIVAWAMVGLLGMQLTLAEEAGRSVVFPHPRPLSPEGRGENTWQAVAEKVTKPWFEKKQLSALVIGVIDKQGKKHFLTLGEKPESLAKLDENTLFEIGSITKTMTSMLLADGIQRMELKLDDPVQQFMPAGVTIPLRDGKPITLEHLATHTSGMPRLAPGQMQRLMVDSKLQEDPYASFDVDQLKKALEGTKINVTKKPKVDYSNFGTGLLGYALTQKYGKGYEALLKERLFEPLGMKSTYLVVPESEKARFIDGFTGAGKPSKHWNFTDNTAGAGGVRSTASDMLLYLQAGMNTNVNDKLTPAFNLALAPQYEMSGKSRIGLNWIMMDMKGKTAHWHNGGTGGFASFAGFIRDAGVAVVILSNRAPEAGRTDQLGFEILGALLEGK